MAARRDTSAMQAIVLAAGLGRRMQPLSDACHKGLLPVAGGTALGRIVDALVEIGVRRITVVTGYRAAEVRHHLEARHAAAELAFVENERYAETNNIVSLALALDAIDADGDVLLVECDLLLDAKVLGRLVTAPAGNVALVDRYRPGMDGTVVSVADGIVTGVFPPEVQGRGFDFDDKLKTLNVYRFTGTFCRTTLTPLVRWYADEVNANAYYEAVLTKLSGLAGHRIAARLVEGEAWAEIDDPNDLAVARFLFEPERRAEMLDGAKGGQWNFEVTDFGFMRNCYYPTEAMLAAMSHALADLVTSYGSSQQVLNEKLAWFLRCRADRLQMLHGAAQAFPILSEMFAGRAVAVPSPTFGEFARAFPDANPFADAPGIDVAAIDTLAADAALVAIVNPNNPTGTTLAVDDVHALARRHPATTFLLDESFIDFSGERPSVARLEEEPLPNVVVLASLSKTLGAPGLRLGYLYSCRPEVVDAVGRRLPIWNLSAPAEFFLELLLKSRDELAASIARTVEDRELFRRDLVALDAVAEVYPSGANFLLVRLRGDGSAASRVRGALLAEASIEVKDVTSRFPDGAPRLRIAVRTPADNGRFIAALACLSEPFLGQTPR